MIRTRMSVVAIVGLAFSTLFVSSGLCGMLGDSLSDSDAVRVCYRVLKYCDEMSGYSGYTRGQEESLTDHLKPFISPTALNEFMSSYRNQYRSLFEKSWFNWDIDDLKGMGGSHKARSISRSDGSNPALVVTINDDSVLAGEPGYAFTFTLAAEESDSVLLKNRVWRIVDLSISSSR